HRRPGEPGPRLDRLSHSHQGAEARAGGVPAPEGGARWQNWQDLYDLVSRAFAALVGLASVIYFLGGTVLAGRLMMYDLPWEIVISQLPQSFLVTVWASEVIVPLLISGLIYSLC